MPIIGTAGHVDHGKSTLVEALTGRDPDRWAEEKERGLTIDLGFAWTDLGGVDVGFVDVPGHERFIKNMLAGVGALDCALLVVAADSGWMPQTEEHASVLDLLDTTVGVIAVTRTDLVDDDTTELAILEIMDEIEGTSLEGWPIVAVSAVTGAGMPELAEQLAEAVSSIGQRPSRQFRMWVDRAFTVSGAGVVVTGTIAQGTISVGDAVQILPGKTEDRVRGLHHHDRMAEHSEAGSRTAINLQNAKLSDVGRGELIATPHSIEPTDRLLATLTPSRSFEKIPQRGAFHLHIGTAHVPASIRQVSGTNGHVIRLETELPATAGDRFILRDSGRQAVVGGGTVLDPQPGRKISVEQVEALRSVADTAPDQIADVLLSIRGIARASDIRMATGGGEPSAGLRAGDVMLSTDAASELGERIQEMASLYHGQFPLRPGIAKPELATRLGVDPDVVEAVVASSDILNMREGAVQLASFSDSFAEGQEAEWDGLKSSMEASFDVPRMSALDASLEVVHALIRRGDLVQVAPDLAFTADQIESIHARIGDLPDGFSVAQFKEAFGMTRRQAVPTLEWLDQSGWTRRSGDGRTVRGSK